MRQVDLVAGLDHVLDRAVSDGLRAHCHDRLYQRQLVQCIAEPGRWFGLTQEGQHLADTAQFLGPAVHAHRHPFHRAEQVDQDRHGGGRAIGIHRVLEQHRRATLRQQTGLDLGHLEHRRDRLADTHQIALALQSADEIAQ